MIMYGFGINIYKSSDPEKSFETALAHWDTYGGRVVDLIEKKCEPDERYRDGYPLKYRTSGKFVKEFLKNGFVGQIKFFGDDGAGYPTSDDPEIINGRFDREAIRSLDDDEEMTIDCWDLS